MDLYHGSNEKIQAITSGGFFGGLFASCDAGVAASHGDKLYIINPQNTLTDFELNYSIQGAWEVAVEICRGDEDKAERIMQAACPSGSDDTEEGLAFQGMRGELARRLGYDAIEMEDEHGTTWLCLPGCKISKITP